MVACRESKAADTLLVPPVISGGLEGGGAQKIITTEGDFLKHCPDL